jgi:pimeloyl-ACP methyl ester carboxylesterase
MVAMPYASSNGARIYYEETGAGVPIIFVHEYAGDHRSWEGQMRHFARGWRCITMSARGYPPSDCPEDPKLYGQSFFTADVIAVMDAAGVDRAHVIGLSMGGYAALMVTLEHSARVISTVAAGAGSGSTQTPQQRAAFLAECIATADVMLKADKLNAAAMGTGPTRVQLQNKDPRAWAEFVAHLGEHPTHAASKTLRTVQAGRLSLYALERQLSEIQTPVLLLVGDEDEPCLDVNIWMKRTVATSELAVLSRSGHAINLEEPALFNQLVERFIVSVDRGTWRRRDPRASGGPALTSLGLGLASGKP